MVEKIGAFQEVITTLTAEAEDLERRAAKVRAVIKDLRDMATLPPVKIMAPTTTAASGGVTQPALYLSKPEKAEPKRRVPTSRLILDAVHAKPGIKFDELAERVIPDIESNATNKRKLVHSTVDYLKSAHKLFFRADGGMYLKRVHDAEEG